MMICINNTTQLSIAYCYHTSCALQNTIINLRLALLEPLKDVVLCSLLRSARAAVVIFIVAGSPQLFPTHEVTDLVPFTLFLHPLLSSLQASRLPCALLAVPRLKVYFLWLQVLQGKGPFY